MLAAITIVVASSVVLVPVADAVLNALSSRGSEQRRLSPAPNGERN